MLVRPENRSRRQVSDIDLAGQHPKPRWRGATSSYACIVVAWLHTIRSLGGESGPLLWSAARRVARALPDSALVVRF